MYKSNPFVNQLTPHRIMPTGLGSSVRDGVEGTAAAGIPLDSQTHWFYTNEKTSSLSSSSLFLLAMCLQLPSTAQITLAITKGFSGLFVRTT